VPFVKRGGRTFEIALVETIADSLAELCESERIEGESDLYVIGVVQDRDGPSPRMKVTAFRPQSAQLFKHRFDVEMGHGAHRFILINVSKLWREIEHAIVSMPKLRDDQ
jgi:hypothetical protein